MTADLASAYLEIERASGTSQAETHDALRTLGLIGEINADGSTAVVAYRPGRGLLVHRVGVVAPTSAQTVLHTLAARLRASVTLMTDDDTYFADAPRLPDDESETTGTETAEPDAAPGREVFLIAGTAVPSSDRRIDLALQLESDLVIAPHAGRLLIVPSSLTTTAQWPAKHRPVVGIRLTTTALSVSVFGTAAVTQGRVRDRLIAMGTPDWVAGWERAFTPVQDEAQGAAVLELQAQIAAWRALDRVAQGMPASDVLNELGVEATALRSALGRELDAATITDILSLFGAGDDVRDVLTGTVTAESLPDAQVVEYRKLGGAMGQILFDEPDGEGFWQWWRRIPHRRPGLAVTIALGWLAIAVAALCIGFSVSAPWNVIAWVLSGLTACSAVGDLLLVRAIQRRKRRRKH